MSAADGAADVSIREQLVARAIAAPSPPRESCRRANGTAQERRALDDRCSSTTESRNDAGDAWAGFDLGRGSLSRNASVRQPRRRASVQRRDRAAVRRRRGSLRAPRRGGARQTDRVEPEDPLGSSCPLPEIGGARTSRDWTAKWNRSLSTMVPRRRCSGRSRPLLPLEHCPAHRGLLDAHADNRPAKGAADRTRPKLNRRPPTFVTATPLRLPTCPTLNP